MIIVVNPRAGGGEALRKLQNLDGELQLRCGDARIISTRSAEEVSCLVASTYARGERAFVAAGGDGCVNAVLQAIMTTLSPAEQRTVSLGAIGLGSSNDFHKPVDPDRVVSGVSFTANVSSARPRDVVAADLSRNGAMERRYFLINASAGLTANANRFFNHPSRPLRGLKRFSSDLAIFYAAIRTIAGYRNIRICITLKGEQPVDIDLTNLAILKSPHVSGSLRFPGEASYCSGLLRFHSARGLKVPGRLRLFRSLALGHCPQGRSMDSWESSEAVLSSSDPFPFEYDGEVVTTDYVRLSVIPRHIQVCTC